MECRAHHVDDLWVDRLGNGAPLRSDILEHLVQRLRLDLLALQLAASVVEVKDDATLLQLLDEQLVPLFLSDVWNISFDPVEPGILL